MTYHPPSRFAPLLIYQIYPSSFYDSNGDGIGDLAGITAKLEYLEWFGVDAIWISPICSSPQKDMGYDISDYCDIDPRYGTLEDFDKLVKEAGKRSIKVLMDLVVNHTSDQHPWFQQSAQSQLDPSNRNEYHDFYIWRQPKVDSNTGKLKPPNNWKSIFQGSVWEPHPATSSQSAGTAQERTEQLPMFLHLYMPSQPDLNWEVPRVRDAVWDVMKFWLDRGVGGFRMDVINLLSKHTDFPDAPVTNPNEEWQYAPMYFANGPRIHEFLREMDDKVLSQYNPRPVTIGEAPHTYNMRTLSQYVLPTVPARPGTLTHDNSEPRHAELDMVFHFEVVLLDAGRQGKTVPMAAEDENNAGTGKSQRKPVVPTTLMHRPFKLAEFKEVTTRWQTYRTEEGFWNSLYLENHDQPRSVSRFSNMIVPAAPPLTRTPEVPEPTLNPDVKRALLSKLLALHLTTLRGTLFVYQGQEIGMANFSPDWSLDEYKDNSAWRFWDARRAIKMSQNGGIEPDMSDIMDCLRKKARDHSRTPMQWDHSPFAGFIAEHTPGSTNPWMRVNDDYSLGWNVAAQRLDQTSVLNFWRTCVRIRKELAETLVYGDFTLLDPGNISPTIFAYVRSSDGRKAILVQNFSSSRAEFSISQHLKEAFGQTDLTELQLKLSTYSNDVGGSHDLSEEQLHGNILDRVVIMRPYEGRLYELTQIHT